jgi:hypothetical protein
MNKEFIPYEQALELRELGFDEECLAYWTRGLNGYYIEYNHYTNKHWMFNANDNKDRDKMCTAPLYQQTFRFFREKYKFTYSIGKTNIAVVHYGPTTQLLQDNESYEAAELAAIKWFIDVAKQQE